MSNSGAGFRLRPATADDAAQIAALLGELGYPTEARDIPPRLDAVIADAGSVLLAVDSTGAALGLLALARHSAIHSPGPVAYIMALVIAHSARRRGVGKVLVEEAKRWARSAGCSTLSVTSAERRADAHAFYPACGLPYTGRRFTALISEMENQ